MIETEPSFSSLPNPKLAPFVIAGAVFVGKAVVGGVIGGAASWGANRILDNRFPSTNLQKNKI
jgi:hypothetical protein